MTCHPEARDLLFPRPKEYDLSSDPSKTTGAILIGGLSLFAAGFLLLTLAPGHSWPMPLRGAGLLLLFCGGLRRRSLTYWIVFAMLFGLELGLDWPQLASHLR
ncbi:MAG TPA: hypothetical protein VN807_03615, partial [Candidatus Sulfotelmatobacter sp.]|nr:hypothetical protein [Candidatus Sulfotelmatobacter sp.]